MKKLKCNTTTNNRILEIKLNSCYSTTPSPVTLDLQIFFYSNVFNNLNGSYVEYSIHAYPFCCQVLAKSSCICMRAIDLCDLIFTIFQIYKRLFLVYN